ncbi:DNA/RNA nuclease SfsA [Anaerotruncus sp. 80]|uniref:Sugar fermentation stimulation protein homolog n=1 Tax=Anaerotruncus colihominis TaxID=169435 RepID=A0A845QMX4_9FIRM|nr:MULTISPECIES: DNA/RNA nuclease SfsA [Anaerotruncus]NBH62996.1 DNA/RNA nuclease SfsA [Anaerotruncus colihominis]NCF03650.1 DNA/RNA nuclease SfsA [Anaerotruncus sp. 80]
MKYENMCKGNFIARPNRFIAEVSLGGEIVRAHVKNTGRCRELLVPGATVYLEDFAGRMGSRKMRYSLIGVEKGNVLINMDSQAPNKVCEEALTSGTLKLPEMKNLQVVKREKTYGDSRFDFYLEGENGKKGWLEIKGVTLEEKGIARFPDAPTERGIKHIYELCKGVEQGYCGYVLFVIQMSGVNGFEPNDRTHPEFGQALRYAMEKGVHILAYDCEVKMDSLALKDEINVNL